MLKLIGIIEIIFMILIAILAAVFFNMYMVDSGIYFFLDSGEIAIINIVFHVLLILFTLIMCTGGFFLIAFHELKNDVADMKKYISSMKGFLDKKESHGTDY